MSVLCGLNTSVAFLGAQLNLARGPVMPRLGGDAAGCGAAQPACLRARPPAAPAAAARQMQGVSATPTP